jgi:hypothetical protein
MKWIKKILDFIVSLVTTWRVIITILIIIGSALSNLFKFLTKISTINLPLWVFIVIAILAFYPIANLIKYLVSRRNVSYEQYSGLRWKKPILPFLNPQAYCPKSDCRCKVICNIKPPERIQLIGGFADPRKIDFENHYRYECPKHGPLSGIPDEDILILRNKAREVLKK